MGTRTRNFANNILTGGKIDGTDFLSGAVPAPNIANSSAVNVDSIPSISNVISPVAGDPPSPSLGDIWYNSVAKKLKYEGFQTATWASGANRNNNIDSVPGGAGPATDMLAFGGYQPPSNSNPVPGTPFGVVGYTGITELYNGTSWSNQNGLNTGGSDVVSLGNTSTTAIAAMRYADGPPAGPSPNGRYGLSSTEGWDGTSWTNLNNSTTNREGGMGFGTQTAGIAVGGNIPHGADSTGVLGESWDGTSWTSGPSLTTSTARAGSSGIQTSGIVTGGESGYNPTTSRLTTQIWDGSTWTNSTNMPEHRAFHGAALTQSIVDSIMFGGNPSPKAANLVYDGTSTWSTGPSLSRGDTGTLGGSGTSNQNALAFAGSPYSNATEEFIGGPLTKNFSNE